jgi:hypothetical protein
MVLTISSTVFFSAVVRNLSRDAIAKVKNEEKNVCATVKMLLIKKVPQCNDTVEKQLNFFAHLSQHNLIKLQQPGKPANDAVFELPAK